MKNIYSFVHSLSLSLSLYIYIYMSVCNLCLYEKHIFLCPLYIYIYMSVCNSCLYEKYIFLCPLYIYIYIYIYQRLKKWYLMPPCLTLSIIRYGSRVKQSNPGKEQRPPLHLGVVAIEKGAFGLPSTMVANFTFYLYI